MSVSGPAWLSIVEGCLVGQAPTVTSETEFNFVVSARNPMGVGSVDLKISVIPIMPTPDRNDTA